MSNILNVLNANFTYVTEEYKSFAVEKDLCRKCNVFDHYKQVCQSEGNAKNPIFMMIGECPGSDEVEQNRPFIGKAGQRLRAELRKYPEVFTKKNTLITNTLACRPLNNKFPVDYNIPKNCVSNWLKREIKLVNPKIIIFVGSQSLKYVHPEGDRSAKNKHTMRGITAMRGTWRYLKQYSCWSFATYHPSYVMRHGAEVIDGNVIKSQIEKDFESDFHKIATSWEMCLLSSKDLEID